MEPGFGNGPLAFYGAGGNAQSGGDFVFRKAAEKTHFDYLSLAAVEIIEPLQGLIKVEDYFKLFREDTKDDIFKRNSDDVPAPFFRAFDSCMVNQDPAHDDGGEAEEMVTVLKLRDAAAHEFEVGFVDECGGLQGVSLPFTAQVAGGEAVKVPVNVLHQVRFC